jgi:Fe-S oxidoreductase
VDVARFKSEFLADYWSRHGTPLSARVMGHLPTLARWGSRFAAIANPIARSRAARWAAGRFLGIDPRRALPPFARRAVRRAGIPNPGVLLFHDTFTRHFQPEIGEAAIRVLRSAGLSVDFAPNVCCGRTLISKGLLAQARDLAERNSRLLAAPAARGAKIVFCEPSCLSAIREDAPSLLRGETQRLAQTVAAASLLFEEMVGAAPLPLVPGPSRILLHGHCHQKAMGLLPPTLALLSRVPGARVVDLDAGCCGMAGSFGYASEHYEVSRQIGERKLLGAVRKMEPGDVLVAPGFSCRHQVKDFAGVEALHPAVLLRSLLQERA